MTGEKVSVCPILLKNPYFLLPKMSFLGKNWVIVYFSANFARKIIAKCVLK